MADRLLVSANTILLHHRNRLHATAVLYTSAAYKRFSYIFSETSDTTPTQRTVDKVSRASSSVLSQISHRNAIFHPQRRSRASIPHRIRTGLTLVDLRSTHASCAAWARHDMRCNRSVALRQHLLSPAAVCWSTTKLYLEPDTVP